MVAVLPLLEICKYAPNQTFYPENLTAGSSWRPVGVKDSRWGKHERRDHARNIISCFFTFLQLSFWEGCAADHSRQILQVLH